MKYFYIFIITNLCIYNNAKGILPSFKLNYAITVAPATTITQGSYFKVIATLRNTGTTMGPFDFECDFESASGVFQSVIDKQCNGTGYMVPINGTITLTFNSSSNNATPISSAPGNYQINIKACNQPLGIAIDFRFKKSLFEMSYPSVELPIDDVNDKYCRFCNIIRRDFFVKKQYIETIEQVAWHPRADLFYNLNKEEQNIINEIRIALNSFKNDLEKEQFLEEIENNLIK